MIHPVFHVSQLKKVIPPAFPVSVLPADIEGLQILEKILQKRMHPDGIKMIPQVLVKWSGMDELLTTWENIDALRQRFPQAPALAQAGGYRGRSVNNPSDTRPRRSSQDAQPNKVCRRCVGLSR